MISLPPGMRPVAARLRRDVRGGTAVEYGFVLVLITLAMVAAFTALANGTVSMWGNVNSKVTNASKN